MIRFLGAVFSILALSIGAAFAATNVQVVKSTGGTEAWLVEDHGLPVISLAAAFDGGARLDPKGKEGSAVFMAALLDEGAGKLDARAFKAALADKAIRYSVSAGRDEVEFGLATLSENRAEAFRLMALTLQKARFDTAAIARVRSQILVALKQNEDDPETFASDKWQRLAFPGSAYGRSELGDARSVQSMNAGDLRAAATRLLTRSSLKVVVVGDIDAKTLAVDLDLIFGGLPKSRAAEPVPDFAFGAAQTKIYARDLPQSVAIFGMPGVKRHDPDFFPAYVMNHILGGGGFSARLMSEIREKRGLVYGVSTGLSPMIRGSALYGQFGTKNATAGQALDLVRAEMVKFKRDGVTEKELKEAKAYMTGSFALRFDSNAGVANQLLTYATDGLPPDFVNKRNAEVEAVTVADIKRAADRLLDPAKMVIVVVGKPVGVAAR
jgi:zinc protease